MINTEPNNHEQGIVSVVIATLGGDTLIDTIKQVNSGSIIPAEILICIPKEEAFRTKNIPFSNVKVIKTPCHGQVAQRIEGFKEVSCKYVMQLDDDMLVDEMCIESLLYSMKKFGSHVAIAPSLVDVATGKSVYKLPSRNKLITRIYYWLMNGSVGYQPGKIDKSGSSVGFDPETCDERWVDVDWLAGGCIMHHSNDLVLENYWTLEGKAYYEDVVHSYELSCKGIRLLIDSSAVCELETFYSVNYKPLDFMKNLLSDYNARKYFMNRCSCKSVRLYFYYGLSCLSYFIKKIIYNDNSIK